MTALAINVVGATRSGLKGDILLPLCCVQNLKTTHAKRTTQVLSQEAIKQTNKQTQRIRTTVALCQSVPTSQGAQAFLNPLH